MQKIQTNQHEEELLTAYIQTTSVVLIRYKAQAVLLASRGVRPEAICIAVNRKPRTVAAWLNDWSARHMASIFSGHQDNTNAAKLTKAQLLQIKDVLPQSPSEYGIPKEMWDVPTLKNYISATFGVAYESPESYYFILRFSGLSFKYPDTFDLKRNEVFIKERMKAITAELAPLLQSEDWEVFSSDEVRMDQEAVIRKCWLKKGERTIIKVDRKKQSQSYIGFLNQKNYQCHLYEMPWQNSDEVLRAMKEFLTAYPEKKICIVWDNAAFHKSKAIRDQLTKGGIMERVHLIAMPPYAPDYNPIEHVWNTAKQAVSNIQRDTFEQTKQAFSDFVASRPFSYSF